MNIRNNIVDYLYDKEYIITMYDDAIYIFNFLYLNDFSDSRVTVSLRDRILKITGSNLTITKITKEELLVKGKITDLGIEYKNED